AEDGIRDKLVTGVQTCALPIYPSAHSIQHAAAREPHAPHAIHAAASPPAPAVAACLPSYPRSPLESGAMPRPDMTAPEVAADSEIGRASCRERGWVWGGEGAGQ